MRTCTQLTPVSAKRTRVEIDYDSDNTMILSNKELILYHFEEGQEIPDEVWTQLQADLMHNAIQKCGKLLMDMDYSRQGLIQKLVRGGYPQNIAEAAADKMAEAGYLDDHRFARSYLQYHLSDRSLTRIRQDLQQKGISSDLIEETIRIYLTEHEDSLDQMNAQEQEQIRRLLEKRHFNLATADYNEMQKTIAFLMRKGYRTDNIRAVMRE